MLKAITVIKYKKVSQITPFPFTVLPVKMWMSGRSSVHFNLYKMKRLWQVMMHLALYGINYALANIYFLPESNEIIFD